MIKVIKNEKLKEILTKRGEIFKKINEINEKLNELDKERKKEAYKMDKLKEKTGKIINKLNINLGEFDIIARVFLEDDECKLEILNRVEEFKKALREENKKDEKDTK